jgi:hypothetical protein
MGVTACQDPHEEPRTPCTISDGRKHHGPPPGPRSPARRSGLRARDRQAGAPQRSWQPVRMPTRTGAWSPGFSLFLSAPSSSSIWTRFPVSSFGPARRARSGPPGAPCGRSARAAPASTRPQDQRVHRQESDRRRPRTLATSRAVRRRSTRPRGSTAAPGSITPRSAPKRPGRQTSAPSRPVRLRASIPWARRTSRTTPVPSRTESGASGDSPFGVRRRQARFHLGAGLSTAARDTARRAAVRRARSVGATPFRAREGW